MVELGDNSLANKKKTENSKQLFDRALSVIPTGIWGHNKWPSVLEGSCYPHFAKFGKGPYLYDVDGNKYIDFVCGFGAMINGYANPRINDAVKEVLDNGDCFPIPTEKSIELAEFLCSTVKGMDWCFFRKTGSDATSAAFIIARAYNSKRKIVCIKDSYNGSCLWNNWCNPGEGRPISDSEMVILLEWNNIEHLNEIFAREGSDIAAVMITPYHHPIPGESILPTPEFLIALRTLCDEQDSLLIVDDVRAGFRLSLAGSHDYFNFDPDITCFSKALGNTQPISATLGKDKFRQAAASIHASGTYCNSSSAMAAALTNLKILKEINGPQHLQNIGQLFKEGILTLAKKYGIPVKITGPVSVPSMTIDGDTDFSLMKEFGKRMVVKGIYVHPTHNWFLSCAHKESDILQALIQVEATFKGMS